MNYVYIATSIDGYIATVDGGIDWLQELPNPDNLDYGYVEFINGIDAVVLGRNSFEKILGFDAWHYDKKVFVVSSSLSEVPAELSGKVEIISGPVIDIVSAIRSQGFENLYIDGGMLIQGFLAEDLIDALIITRIPILLGDGIPLFGNLSRPLKFVHKETKIYSNALVQSFYRRDKARG